MKTIDKISYAEFKAKMLTVQKLMKENFVKNEEIHENRHFVLPKGKMKSIDNNHACR